MTIGVTGHRPNKLPDFGYDYSNPKWLMLKETFKKILISYNCTEAVCGMALGVDTVFAIAVLELKKEGYPIKLHCAIPCLNQSCRWPAKSQKQYDEILAKADVVKVVTEEKYSPYLMQVRNEYMVDISDIMVAVWDGTAGGTGNCVNYIADKHKPMIWIKPENIKE